MIPKLITYKTDETIKFEQVKPKETKSRINLLRKQSNAKTFKAYIESSIKLIKEENKKILNQKVFTADDFITLLEELKLKYLDYNKPIEQELKKEYGKSSFTYKELPEIIEIETYQNKKPITKHLIRKESDWIMNTLEKFKEKKPEWNSIQLGLMMAETFGYEPKTIKDYYADRIFQNYWTTHLRYLREIGLIEYMGGIVKLK